jgi:hypothetical protein
MLVVLADMTVRPFPRMPGLGEYRATNVKEALIAASAASRASAFVRSGTVGYGVDDGIGTDIAERRGDAVIQSAEPTRTE